MFTGEVQNGSSLPRVLGMGQAGLLRLDMAGQVEITWEDSSTNCCGCDGRQAGLGKW